MSTTDRWSFTDVLFITQVVHEPSYSGLCRQVVLIQRCLFITQWLMNLAKVVSANRCSFNVGGQYKTGFSVVMQATIHEYL